MHDWVQGSKEVGFFDPARGFRKLGLLDDSCEPSVLDDPQAGLRAYLRDAGVTSVSEFRLSCDAASQQQQIPQAILQHIQAGVTHVALLTNALTAKTYVQTADGQLFHPRYSVSDLWNLTNESQVRDFPDSFDGVVTVSQLRAGELKAGKPLAPLAQQCSKVLTDHGLAPIKGYNEDLLVLQTCEAFQLFLKLATAGGVNPTRKSVVAALPSIGDFSGATFDLARFNAPGKTTGGDTIATIAWSKACRCWTQTAGFRPAPG